MFYTTMAQNNVKMGKFYTRKKNNQVPTKDNLHPNVVTRQVTVLEMAKGFFTLEMASDYRSKPLGPWCKGQNTTSPVFIDIATHITYIL